jgi:ribosome-interacting GTPase 1
MEHGQKLDVKELIDEVVRVFKLKKDKKHLDALKQRIIKIRYGLYYERRKQKKKSFL